MNPEVRLPLNPVYSRIYAMQSATLDEPQAAHLRSGEAIYGSCSRISQ